MTKEEFKKLKVGDLVCSWGELFVVTYRGHWGSEICFIDGNGFVANTHEMEFEESRFGRKDPTTGEESRVIRNDPFIKARLLELKKLIKESKEMFVDD